MEQRICSIDGCERPIKSRGWCGAHYYRWRKHGSPQGGEPERPPRAVRTCSIEGCESPYFGLGYCNVHYQRFRRHGDTEAMYERHPTSEASFAARTRQEGDCIVWTGHRNDDGYGGISVGGVTVGVHRYAWERANGPIPAGMTIDHTCWNRACVNTEHLRLASVQENSWNLSGPQENNRLGIRNVYPLSGGYIVRVKKDGKDHTSWHKGLDEARVEAEKLRQKLFGDFAGAPHMPTEYETGDSDEHR